MTKGNIRGGFVGNFGLLKKCWAYRRQIRALLSSESYIFVRDFPPGHFYSPLPDLSGLREHVEKTFRSTTKEMAAIDLNEKNQCELLSSFRQFYAEMFSPEIETAGYRYYYDNAFFSYGDGVTLYAMLRWLKPRRIVEIGSGFSSAEMLDVNERCFDGNIKFTFIEPYPDRLNSLLSAEDKQLVRIECAPVQDVDKAVFEALEAGDILFVDSSHVGKVGSDVLYLLFEILPLLRDGVIVHFHDVFWPFEYPAVWLEGGRAWNEAYFLRAFLQYNSAFEIVYFNSFMAANHREAVNEAMPLALKTPSNLETFGNSSIWIRKDSSPAP